MDFTRWPPIILPFGIAWNLFELYFSHSTLIRFEGSVVDVDVVTFTYTRLTNSIINQFCQNNCNNNNIDGLQNFNLNVYLGSEPIEGQPTN